MRRLMPATVDYPGPIYIRLGKGGDPIVAPNVPFEIGKGYVVREGADALIVTTGVTLKVALDAADLLKQEGITASVLHLPTIKPLDTKTILESAAKVSTILVVEEHTVLGGLGSAVAEVLMEAGFSDPKKFKRIGIPDVFPEGYGSQASMMEKYGITAKNVVETVKRLRN
jgi:transketolase